MDISFHYPPELLSLLVDTIPLLCRSKKDTILFVKGAGVSETFTSDLAKRISANPKEISKYEIVRTVLERLNERGEPTLRERREIVKRVVQFEDFTTCWEGDRLKAQGLVAQIQKLVNVKDSFTRMKLEKDGERRKIIQEKEKELAEKKEKRDQFESLKQELFSLFNESNPQVRGKRLESVLNRLFEMSGISVSEAFEVIGPEGEGTVEQIDGVIKLDGNLYFVEMKWWNKPIGVPEVSQHMMRVFLRAESRAIIISASGFTSPAVAVCCKALSKKVVTLCTLEELVLVLENSMDLALFLRRKVEATIMEESPFPSIPIE